MKIKGEGQVQGTTSGAKDVSGCPGLPCTGVPLFGQPSLPWLLRELGAGGSRMPEMLPGLSRAARSLCVVRALPSLPEPGITPSTDEELEMPQKEGKWELGIRPCGCLGHQHQSTWFSLTFKADIRDVTVFNACPKSLHPF